VEPKPSSRISPEALLHAEQAIKATPTLESLAREMGEENMTLKPNGEFKVDAPDFKSAKLLREMFQERNRAEAKLTGELDSPTRPPLTAEQMHEKERHELWIAEGRRLRDERERRR
jgi:hypothetical protein